ncbi:PD-(D/E)XK nuclease-like domain-containing protein [Nocardioides sp.]|uniref:PD-(D/E)XK nuclease-like domain-containing protein n=1 Tax=Nocardioides sp. TaxID=35761 RepID=UPI0035194F76
MIRRDIPEHEYHADRTSLSQSGAKILLDEGPAAFRWQQDHPRVSDAFDFGHAAHKHVLGVGAEIVVHEYDTAKVKSPRATSAWKEQQAEVRERGGILLLPDEWAVVEAMATKLREHTTAMRLLAEGEPEVSIYAEDSATGVLRRGRVDWLHPTMCVDYKTTAGTVHPKALAGRYGTVRRFHYDQQVAWYLDLLRDHGHPAEDFAFIFQSKTAPYDVTVALVPESELYEARDRNAEALRIFAACTASGEWPGPVRPDSWAVLSLDRPTYTEEYAA